MNRDPDAPPSPDPRPADAPDAGDAFLNDAWTLRAHHPDAPDWTNRSYVMLSQISSVADFWTAWNSVAHAATRTMLFLTREHVFPAWDDPACIDGCTASFISQESDAGDAFLEMAQRALGETMVDPELWDTVNGVSIAPKRGFNVIKVWLATPTAPDIRRPRSLRAVACKVTPCRQAITARNDTLASAPASSPAAATAAPGASATPPSSTPVPDRPWRSTARRRR